MSVDLSSGKAGIIEFADGRRFYCLEIERQGQWFRVRIESGVGFLFSQKGERYRRTDKDRDIVSFQPMPYDDPRAKGLPTEITP